MRRGVFLAACLALAGCAVAGRPARGGDAPTPAERPFGLQRRTPWTTSRVVGSPEPPPPYRLARVFPRLKFEGPVCIAQEPGTNRLLVGQNNGKVYAFPIDDPNASKPEVFLDAGRQLYSFSFHPKYAENGEVFVFSPLPGQSRVSRFRTNREHPRKVDPRSEQVIIEWPSGGHNGGEAVIGPDGYLYVCTGDGTGGSDPNNTGQGVDDLFSVMMRIDVDHPDPGRNYSIPKDNPFINHPGARPEIWAHGFRNPWRMSFDPETGRLFVGDVGQDLWEMIWEVKKGGNYGWSVQEGSHPFHPHKKAGPGPILPPVVEHHHTECRSITGGYVYHGDKFPELRGAYVYGDYQYGKVWAFRYDGQKVTWHRELADSAVFIAGFAHGRNGEIYAVDNTSGFVHALERTPPGSAASDFPRVLSRTGLFASVKDRTPAPGVIAYSVNAPQWADGASIDRLLGLSGETKISDANGWGFPDGMVLAQTLSLEREAGRPQSRAPVETRVLVKQDGHWMGYSYLWDDAGTDAALVGAAGAERSWTLKDPSAPGGSRQQTWRVPGRDECMFCHSRAAGFVLGLNTPQMNRDHDYGGTVDNQLRAFSHAGLFQAPLDKPAASLPKYVNPYDEKADLNDRVRTYLQVNCSICHVSDGGGNSYIELAYSRKLEETRTIGTRPVQGTFGIPDAKIVAPGEPERSVLYYRVSSLGGARMPRVGSRVVDDKAVAMLHDWIGRMPNPGASAATKAARDEAKALLDVLRQGDKPARAGAIGRLCGSTSGALTLATAIGRGAVPPEAAREVIAATRDHPAAEVRDLFERFVPEAERVRRLGERIDPAQILGLKGDAARGRQVFEAESVVNCKSCHKLGGVGVELGPDLSAIGAKYPRAELLGHILEPSRTVDPKFTVYHVATQSGLVHTGLLVERTETEIVLRDARNELIRVPASDLEALTPQKQSLMPDLLLRSLTAQQAADLLEYLASQKPKPGNER
jgi:uncharacterized repeat protein (TIGR03806 family)